MAKLDPIIEFREDQQKVRDSLFDLAGAAEAEDVAKARDILGQIDTIVGPHFRYEEETLYPAMKEFLGDYVDSLIGKHGSVIDTAKTAAQLLSKSFSDQRGRTGGCQGSQVASGAREQLRWA